MKYRPDFPGQFGCLEDARSFCATFYRWYNHDHRHSGIGMHIPFDVHHGHATDVRLARANVLNAAYAATPERFVRKQPEPLRRRLDQPTRPAATSQRNEPTENMTR